MSLRRALMFSRVKGTPSLIMLCLIPFRHLSGVLLHEDFGMVALQWEQTMSSPLAEVHRERSVFSFVSGSHSWKQKLRSELCLAILPPRHTTEVVAIVLTIDISLLFLG